jgi:hypothetical protein
MIRCEICQQPIPAERLEALPTTRRCVEHSDTKAVLAFNVYDHKTAPILVIINPDDTEAVRRAQRAHHRAR